MGTVANFWWVEHFFSAQPNGERTMENLKINLVLGTNKTVKELVSVLSKNVQVNKIHITFFVRSKR